MNSFDSPPASPLRTGRDLLGAMLFVAAFGAADELRAAPPPPAEVQINLCAAPERVALALGLAADGVRTAWYFDTRDLALANRGVVFRLRQAASATELSMKIARQDCAALPSALIPKGEGKCELDLHGDSMHGAVSIARALDAEASAALLAGRMTLREALSPAQIRFLDQRLGLWPPPDGIVRLGPVRIDAYRRKAERFVLEAWTLPGGETHLEISQKSTSDRAYGVRDALLRRLAAADVAVCADQSSQSARKLGQLAH